MAPTIRTIGSYATQQRYSVDFFGEELFVTVTPDPSVIGQWIHDVFFHNRLSSHPLVVGVGVQWTPSGYHPASPPVSYRSDSSPDSYRSDSPPVFYSSDPPADTLQLCVGNRCIIIQLRYCERVPQVLRNFLADRDNTFVGIWNSQDAGKLERSRHQLEIAELMDLREFVSDSSGRRSMYNYSLEKIVEENLGYPGVRLDREVSMSDWRVYNLSYDQILQASIDVYACCSLAILDHLWEEKNRYYSDSSSGGYYDPPADTLQLCVGNRCIIIQLSHCDRVPRVLHNFLAYPDYTFVGVWNSQDARKLERSRHQLEIDDLLDLRKYVEDSSGRRSMRGCSFEVIVEECLGYRGVRLDREISMSDWSAYELCDDQILQASIDAHVCFKLGVKYRLWKV
ncbi:Ribonuclease H-like superfamily [Arabidopsis thaliana x Arabidopsis arenosa]|uniref:Ribonuclease H-like superfamily n=1 Tax=Arabidopsis thaliana x Arabidopsis arenosa TaxID=1240361 RepID=A0A8T2ERD5_9BRAS|nr:Ribonuclease H-like superfamily [Arabidopsis thaliana x Arabidopsis arenosa]